MKRIFLFIFFLAISKTAFSVCLEKNPTVSQEYEKSLAVLTGKVISIEKVPESSEYFDVHNYTINVQEVFKGDITDKIKIFSENSSGRFPMEKGSIYILFVYMELSRLQVNNCGNSGLLTEKEDVVTSVRKLMKNNT